MEVTDFWESIDLGIGGVPLTEASCWPGLSVIKVSILISGLLVLLSWLVHSLYQAVDFFFWNFLFVYYAFLICCVDFNTFKSMTVVILHVMFDLS